MTARRLWTDDEMALLAELWPMSCAVDLEDIFGRSSDCINQKARHLGLSKAESFRAHNRYGIYTHKGNRFDNHIQ